MMVLARRSRLFTTSVLAGAVAIAGSSLGADPEPLEAAAEPGSGQARMETASGVGRAELALAYLRFDRAFAGATVRGTDLARVNRRFDALTRLFFFRRFAEAITALNSLTASLDEEDAGPTDGSTGLLARLEPPVWIVGTAEPFALRLTTLDPGVALPNEPLRLTLRGPTGAESLDVRLDTITSADVRTATIPLPSLASRVRPGRYAVELSSTSLKVSPAPLTRPFDVTARSFDAVRSEYDARLSALSSARPELERARQIAAARTALLSDRPPPGDPSPIVVDPHQLERELAGELAALSEGRNPYRRLAGDHWRIVRSGGVSLPLRVFAPIEGSPELPRPLVVALHGAGGDENLFMDGYGAGLLKRLASERGFIAVTPRTYGFLGSAVHLDRLIEDLREDYVIDERRIYVLGHSLGAIATVGFAAGRPGTVAAACCIAGFRPIPDGSACAPLLVLCAELDPIFRPDRVGAALQRAERSGVRIESRVLKDQGHTLVVNEALPIAIDWLLGRSLKGGRP